jgi:LSD1 subclass zinc finger protein
MVGKSFLAYRTSKNIMVDYWEVGLLYYALSLALLIYYFNAAWAAGDYMMRVPIQGNTFAFPESFSHPYYSCVGDGTCSTVRPNLYTSNYCSAPNYNFYYSNDFKYFSGSEAGSGGADPVGPECQMLDGQSIMTKDINKITMSTVYTENQKFGWPQGGAADCDSVGTPFAVEAKAQCNSAVTRDPTTGQCECAFDSSVFPMQMENYTINIAHSYTVNQLLGSSWSGTSSDPSDSLDTKFVQSDGVTAVTFPNGTQREYQPGTPIQLTIHEMLSMAEIKNEDGTTSTGIRLDDANNYVAQTDARAGKSNYPKFRHTGVMLEVDMEYSNREGAELVIGNKDVNVKISVHAKPHNWVSVGPSYFYPTYPTGPPGQQTFHSVVRYPQDIYVQFKVKGYAYGFNPMFFMQSLVVIFVSLGVVGIFVDTIVFYLLPNGVSLVLRNKRSEYTSRIAAFQEMGMKAAISVGQFARMDEDKTGALNLAQLTKVFGKVNEVDRERAMQIAKTILGNQDTVDFEQFMTMTHGDAITFKEYLKLVKKTGGNVNRLSLMQREQAMKAYADVEQGIELPAETTDPARQSAAVTPTQPTAVASSPLQPIAVMRPPQPVLPAGVVKLMCHSCRRAFGVPAGAKMVACPHCAAVNNCQTVVQPM